MKKKLLVFLFASLLVFGLAACSNKEDAKEPANGTQTEEVIKDEQKNEEVTPTGNVVEVQVSMSNFEYDKKEIRAKLGDTVKLTVENSNGAHGLAIDEFDVDIKGGETAEFIVDKAGEYDFYCSLMCGTGHDTMVGKLIVQ